MTDRQPGEWSSHLGDIAEGFRRILADGGWHRRDELAAKVETPLELAVTAYLAVCPRRLEASPAMEEMRAEGMRLVLRLVAGQLGCDVRRRGASEPEYRLAAALRASPARPEC